MQAGHKNEALKSCQEVLDINENSADTLCDLADLYVNSQDYEKGKFTCPAMIEIFNCEDW